MFFFSEPYIKNTMATLSTGVEQRWQRSYEVSSFLMA